ncbi:MAG: acyl carrier protein [Deltaproteobacteria bacterium]|nr:acyl carrier protein [Deltaproteobacteria bacterium]
MKKGMEEFAEIFATKFPESTHLTLTDDTPLDEIPGWDSLEGIDFISRIEKYYHITFELEEIADFATLGDVKRAISAR